MWVGDSRAAGGRTPLDLILFAFKVELASNALDLGVERLEFGAVY